jgi:hypothetical protein
MRPPYPGGQRIAFAARSALSQIGKGHEWAFGLTGGELYTHVTFKPSTSHSLLSALIPRALQDEEDSVKDLRGHIKTTAQYLHVEALPWSSVVANLLLRSTSVLTFASIVSIGPAACQSIGQSIMMAHTLRALAQPVNVCINAGRHGLLTSFALGHLVFPGWVRLRAVTFHNAHQALVPGEGRQHLFLRNVEYILAFGPSASEETWCAMASLLRSLLRHFEERRVCRVQVILPFNAQGTLQPPRVAARRQPFAPLRQLPAPLSGTSQFSKPSRDDLPSVARRFVLGERSTTASIVFLPVELFRDRCEACLYTWTG